MRWNEAVYFSRLPQHHVHTFHPSLSLMVFPNIVTEKRKDWEDQRERIMIKLRNEETSPLTHSIPSSIPFSMPCHHYPTHGI